VLLLCSGCSGPAPGHAFFRDEKPGVQVIAHRGGAGLRPENTLAAFQHAAQIIARKLAVSQPNCPLFSTATANTTVAKPEKFAVPA